MKVILNVFENWMRRYEVEVPDDTNPNDVLSEAIELYRNTFGAFQDTVRELGAAEYIDDAPADSWFIEEPFNPKGTI